MTSFAWLLATALTFQAAPAAPPTTAAIAEAYFLFIQGRTHDASGDVDAAIAAYRQALALVPRAAEIHAELASVFGSQGRAGESLTEAQAALTIEPDNRQAHRIFGLVQAALAQQSPDPVNQRSLVTQAIDHLERSIAGNVRDPLVDLTLGRLFVNAGTLQKAVDRLQLFLLDRPDYPEALMLLGTALDALGRPAEAAAAVAQLLAEQPAQGGQPGRDVQVRTWLAELYEKSGRWADAAGAWGEIARRNPRVAIRSRQASALINAGQLDDAKQQLTELSKIAPRDPSVWYLLAQAERRAGNSAAAEDAARQIAGIDAADARGPLALAGAMVARGDYRGAIGTLEPRVNAATDAEVTSGLYAQMAGELAEAIDKDGDRSRAIRVLEGARRKDPESESLRFALAGVYDRAKQRDRAEGLLRELVTKEPSNAGALNYLGYLMADRGDRLPEAVDLIKRALAIETDNPSFLDSLGWAYVKQAKLDDARDPLERAARARPRASVIQDHLGELYFLLKRYRDAAEAWDRALAGDRDGIDTAAMTRKRDRARALAARFLG